MNVVTKRTELEAEIERLQADVEYWHHIATVEKNGLITELCDALDITTQLLLVSELPTYVVENKISENRLMQKRAREATKCQP